VAVTVLVGVKVGVGVLVGVRVGVPVGVDVAVFVGVDVGVELGVKLGVGVQVAVGVAVLVGVAVGVSVGVLVDVLVGDAVGVAVCVGVGVHVGVLVGVGVFFTMVLSRTQLSKQINSSPQGGTHTRMAVGSQSVCADAVWIPDRHVSANNTSAIFLINSIFDLLFQYTNKVSSYGINSANDKPFGIHIRLLFLCDDFKVTISI